MNHLMKKNEKTHLELIKYLYSLSYYFTIDNKQIFNKI